MNNWLADMRTWAVCLTAYCAACTSAVACMVRGAVCHDARALRPACEGLHRRERLSGAELGMRRAVI